MGKQYNKENKRRRRAAYRKRCKERIAEAVAASKKRK